MREMFRSASKLLALVSGLLAVGLAVQGVNFMSEQIPSFPMYFIGSLGLLVLAFILFIRAD
jgi:uncharacterized membrane protein (DUF441 family)